MRRQRVIPWIGIGFVLILSGWLARQFFRQTPILLAPAVDMVATLQANNEGIGLMEQFNYERAISAFERVQKIAPDWQPGKINLGIALLNTATAGNLEKARGLFDGILREEPRNPYGHYCLGIIMKYQDKPEERMETAAHFETVTQIDPRDPAAWYNLGMMKTLLSEDTKEAVVCFRQATQLDPHLTAAVYALYINLRQQNPAEASRALEEHSLLQNQDDDSRGNLIGLKYGEMGRYAEVIGQAPNPVASPRIGPMPLFQTDEKFQVALATGKRWASCADFGTSDEGKVRALMRARFGAAMVILDYNQDGKPDLFLLGAVVENGNVQDLLLRNDGADRFTDVTREAGLAEPRPSLGCCVADFDNDGYPDLFISGAGVQRLFRNTGKGTFEDVTARAGLDHLKSVCLGAAFVDLDQDGDLDLVIGDYGPLGAHALEPDAGRAKGMRVYINVGEALVGKNGALATRFRSLEETGLLPSGLLPAPAIAVAGAGIAAGQVSLLGGKTRTTAMVVSDFDLDRDLDLLILADGAVPEMLVNDRLLRFHRQAVPELGSEKSVSEETVGPLWNGGLVLDANHDGRSDLFLLRSRQRPLFYLNRAGSKFESAPTNAPPLIQAQAVDVDLDGWTDIVGLDDDHRATFLHNDGQRLFYQADGLGNASDWPKKLVAVRAADFDGDGYPDLLLWSESKGLQLRRNMGNGNHCLSIKLTGRRGVEPNGAKVRTNADGIGTWVTAQAGDLIAGAENTTLAAGLGQSEQTLHLGLGKYSQADVVRMRWTDGVLQAELNMASGAKTISIPETNRKSTSCPLLFTWNGERFVFVTDFLGAGSMGECQPGGGHRPPRPRECVKIEADQLVPRDGTYVLKLTEPMDEVTYLDRLQLMVVDHPQICKVHPDERFSGEQEASQDILALGEEIFPLQARDQAGLDVTRTLRSRDRDTVNRFAGRGWLGYADEHSVELDFGARLAHFKPTDRLFLCLAGWTDYPYPEAIWAAAQAGVVLQPPILEKRDQHGEWRPLIPDLGYPAGLPRMMTREISGLVQGSHCVLRLRTNMEIYWDQIFVAPLLETVRAGAGTGLVRSSVLEVGDAALAPRGCAQEFSPDGRQPTLYDYHRIDATPTSRPAGRLTRYGNVTELLRREDDRFVLFGPGDEVTVRFDAASLPVLPPGWVRGFVLKTWGYCKDCSPFTDTGATVEPLPFKGMSDYPYGALEHYPDDAGHREYRRRFNSR